MDRFEGLIVDEIFTIVISLQSSMDVNGLRLHCWEASPRTQSIGTRALQLSQVEKRKDEQYISNIRRPTDGQRSLLSGNRVARLILRFFFSSWPVLEVKTVECPVFQVMYQWCFTMRENLSRQCDKHFLWHNESLLVSYRSSEVYAVQCLTQFSEPSPVHPNLPMGLPCQIIIMPSYNSHQNACMIIIRCKPQAL